MKKAKLVIVILSAIAIIEAIIIIFLMTIGRPKKKIIKPARPGVQVALKGKIAIVLDDWGYNLTNLAILKQIKYPLTLSVLPNLEFSATLSKEAKSLGKEIILHLPLEPLTNHVTLEKNTILTTMKEQEIRRIVDEDVAQLGNYIKGVSNHMGSRATNDVRTMSIVLSELKKKRMYFFDSYTSEDSVCPLIAHKIGLGFAKRDVFLDNREEPEYIRTQIQKLKLIAKSRGAAIGIGHDRKITLQVLKEVMPELEKEGYKFIYLSEQIQ